ncbi:MAG: GNAT family N-acetyltransferase [Sulfobacillus sp.]
MSSQVGEPVLPTEPLELRPVRPQHAEAIFALTQSSRAHLAPWMPWIHTMTDPTATLEFVRQAMTQESAGNGTQFGIWWGGQLAGVIGYHPIRWPEREADIGYWLGQAFEGHGLITRSAAAVLDQAFLTLGLDIIGIRTAEANRRSQRVAERLGFGRVGILTEGEWFIDHWIPLVVYQLTSAQWSDRLDPAQGSPAVILAGS